MDRTIDTLTALLLDPFLTHDEAQREAAATYRRVPTKSEPSTLRRSARTRFCDDEAARFSERCDLN
ncbi:MAG: hypothetical protein K8U57_29875 [Planctomycetes bacterium]|nr:hypothetical protein [Planctomycetota bacterium]